MIYLDNAATSWPKPPGVAQAMVNFLEQVGGNPGRSGHRSSIEAARILFHTREEVASLFHAGDPLRVIFSLNATHAINYALKGLLKPGDSVITTSMEHNAVMRPLRALEQQGVMLNIVHCDQDGSLNPEDVRKAISPRIKLAVVTHASNIVGTIAPIHEIAEICHRNGCLLLVDAAQTAGVLPIYMQGMGIDLLAFTGHKGLLGPTGTGGLVIGERVDINDIESLIHGGTGSRSQYEYQPEMLPDKFESGTPNIVGLAGLYASLRWIRKRGLDSVRQHEIDVTRALLEALQNIPGIVVYGTLDPLRSVAIVSITFKDKPVSEIGLLLDEHHGILCRVGLHCAPAAHRTIGTFPEGTIRIAPGIFTSLKDIQETILAIKAVASQ
jgi:cysteine desulfurase/selenocysteine lyase